MQIRLTENRRHHTVTSYGNNCIRISARCHAANAPIPSERIIEAWAANCIDKPISDHRRKQESQDIEISPPRAERQLHLPRLVYMHVMVASSRMEAMNLLVCYTDRQQKTREQPPQGSSNKASRPFHTSSNAPPLPIFQ